MISNLKYLPIFILPLGCIGISSGFQVLSILFFLFYLFKRKINYNYSSFFKSSIVRISLSMIFLWIICVIIADLVFKGNIGGFKDGWNYLQRMLPFFLVGLFAINEKKFLKFTWCGICLSLLIVNIDVLYNFFIQGKWRPMTMFNGPNRLGAFLIMLLPFVVCGAYKYINCNRLNLISCLIAILGLFSLFVSGSRGAILGILLGCLISFLIIQIKLGKIVDVIKILLLGILILMIAIVIGYILYPELVVRSYDMERLYIWQSALRMIADYPVWGVGAGHFNDIYVNNGYINVLAKEPHLQHPHNIFLFYFVERGIFTGITFMLMISTQIYLLVKNIFNKSKKLNVFALASLVMIVGAVIQGCVDVVMDNRTYQLMYWFLYGVACYSIVLDKDDKESV